MLDTSKGGKIICGDKVSQAGRFGERHATPALSRFGHAVPLDQFRSVSQADDDPKTKPGACPQFEEFIGPCSLYGDVAARHIETSCEHFQREPRSQCLTGHARSGRLNTN